MRELLGFLGKALPGESLRAGKVLAEFGAGRQRAFDRLERWLPLGTGRMTGEATRQCLAALPDDSEPAEIMGALAVGVPAIVRHQRGLVPVPPDPALPTAADFLKMVMGKTAAPDLMEACDTYFTVTA
jgi:citrate synthase